MSSLRANQFFKTKMCPWFTYGRCEMGYLCRFAHHDTELRIPPNLHKTSLCPSVLRGGCCKHESCNYAHHVDELRYTENLYKTSLCYYWIRGNCKMGGKCRHAHGNDELRAKSSNEKLKLEGGGDSSGDDSKTNCCSESGDKSRSLEFKWMNAGLDRLNRQSELGCNGSQENIYWGNQWNIGNMSEVDKYNFALDCAAPFGSSCSTTGSETSELIFQNGVYYPKYQYSEINPYELYATGGKSYHSLQNNNIKNDVGNDINMILKRRNVEYDNLSEYDKLLYSNDETRNCGDSDNVDAIYVDYIIDNLTPLIVEDCFRTADTLHHMEIDLEWSYNPIVDDPNMPILKWADEFLSDNFTLKKSFTGISASA